MWRPATQAQARRRCRRRRVAAWYLHSSRAARNCALCPAVCCRHNKSGEVASSLCFSGGTFLGSPLHSLRSVAEIDRHVLGVFHPPPGALPAPALPRLREERPTYGDCACVVRHGRPPVCPRPSPFPESLAGPDPRWLPRTAPGHDAAAVGARLFMPDRAHDQHKLHSHRPRAPGRVEPEHSDNDVQVRT